MAIVGGGFGGIGAAVMLQPRGLRRRDRLRARRPHRRRLELQHLSGHRLRRALAPLRVLVRAQPELVAALLAGATRSRRTWRTWRAATACSTGCGCAPRSRAPRSTRARCAGCSRPRPGRTRPTCWSRRAASCPLPRDPADPRPRGLRRARVPHRPLAPRRGPRRQARRARGHRLQLDPGRPVDPARRGPARRLPALAGLDAPEDGLRVRPARAAALRARCRRSSGSTAR